MFDGGPIAEARSDGHGGSTFVRALQSQAALLARPNSPEPAVGIHSTHRTRGRRATLIDMTLGFLVDQLADAMHAGQARAAFNRDIGNRCCSSRTAGCRFLKGINAQGHLPTAQRVSKLPQPTGPAIVLIWPLPADEAFAIWKQHVLGDKPRVNTHRTV